MPQKGYVHAHTHKYSWKLDCSLKRTYSVTSRHMSASQHQNTSGTLDTMQIQVSVRTNVWTIRQRVFAKDHLIVPRSNSHIELPIKSGWFNVVTPRANLNGGSDAEMTNHLLQIEHFVS
eukprot:6467276-Amphidinium_carterae.2